MAGDSVEDLANELPRRKVGGKALVLYVILPLLMFSGGAAALYVSGVLDGLLGSSEASVEPEPVIEPDEPGVFYDLPQLLVNLTGEERRQTYLAISISLELGSEEDIEHVERVMPRIIDNFQVYLRELRLDELRGSAGLYRLREELLRRVHMAAQPARVRDVLFREMLLQN
ncbi:MAG: flagellar basal body protein FliL [Alphaproteobacteria bacterium]|jgi:flagellar FliL protein|nr:flagellar basal body protein FliL [Alphaproteobacteria bacterium]